MLTAWFQSGKNKFRKTFCWVLVDVLVVFLSCQIFNCFVKFGENYSNISNLPLIYRNKGSVNSRIRKPHSGSGKEIIPDLYPIMIDCSYMCLWTLVLCIVIKDILSTSRFFSSFALTIHVLETLFDVYQLLAPSVLRLFTIQRVSHKTKVYAFWWWLGLF